jgi:hypothetical protein
MLAVGSDVFAAQAERLWAGWRKPLSLGVCDVPEGHARMSPFPQAIASRIREPSLPIYHRTYRPGELQFIITRTYRQTPVFFSPRFCSCDPSVLRMDRLD